MQWKQWVQKLCRFDVGEREKSTWRTHRYFVDFESRIHLTFSSSNRYSNFHVEFRHWIEGESTKMCPLGWDIAFKTSKLPWNESRRWDVCWDIYIYIPYPTYIYIYIYPIYMFFFIVTLWQHVHTLVTLVSHSHNLFQLVLLDHCHK